MKYFTLLFLIILLFFSCKEKSSPVDSDNGDNGGDESPQITVNWQLTNGPAGGTINTIAFNPGGYVYAGTDGNGIFRSSDNGDSWQEANDEIWNMMIRCLCVNEQGHIFAATGSEGLFRSSDQGVSWQDISLGRGGSLNIIAIGPDGEIFIGDDHGIERSSDNGNNWVSTGLPGAYAILFFDSDKMLIAGWDSVYFSQDNCQTWMPVAPIYNVRSFVIDANSNIFAAGYSGILRSTDKGFTWTKINETQVKKIAINSAGNLFIVTFPGEVFRSTNGGASWEGLYQDESDARIIKINSDDHIFLGTGDDLLRSVDNGENWNAVGVPASIVTRLAIDANDRIFAISSNGINRCDYVGDRWVRLDPGVEDDDFGCVAVNSQGDVFVGDMRGIYRSTDHGDTWAIVAEIGVKAFLITANGYMFAAGMDNGVYCSTDDGSSWQLIGLEDEFILVFAINSDDQIIAAGGCVFGSTDYGETWQKLGEFHSEIITAAIDDSGYIYVGTDYAGEIYCTKDYGQYWLTYDISDYNYSVKCLTVDHNNYIFAGGSGGICCSTNRGKDWFLVNNGLIKMGIDAIVIQDLAVNSENKIFAASFGWGVYRGEISTVTKN